MPLHAGWGQASLPIPPPGSQARSDLPRNKLRRRWKEKTSQPPPCTCMGEVGMPLHAGWGASFTSNSPTRIASAIRPPPQQVAEEVEGKTSQPPPCTCMGEVGMPLHAGWGARFTSNSPTRIASAIRPPPQQVAEEVEGNACHSRSPARRHMPHACVRRNFALNRRSGSANSGHSCGT